MDFYLTLLLFSSSLFLLLLLSVLRRQRLPACKCDTCRSFLTGAWAASFPSLPDWYAHLLRRSPTATIQIHVLNNTVTADPANVEYILKTKFDTYVKGKPHSVILGDLLGRGIFVVDGDHWRFQRRLASLELGSVSVRSFAFASISSEIQHRLLPLFSSLAAAGDLHSPEVDLQDIFRRFAFDNICRLSFGIDPSCLGSATEFADAFDIASKLSAERALQPAAAVWKLKRALNLGSERRLKKAVRKINLLAESIIRERRKVGFSTRKDLLSRFMGSISDEKYLRDIVVSFLLAGRDTVASAITVFFLLVGQNPEVESKIREESERVLGPGNPAQLLPTFEQLREFHYLHAAMHETLRLYPPVQIDSKYAEADDILPDGTWIRKGDKVSFHPYAMGRMPQIWGPDCLHFKPQRWLDQNGAFCPVSLYKYPVFQAGFRVCLGKELALITMKIVCVSLLRLFDIRLVGPVVPPHFVPGLTATLEGGLSAVVRPRRGSCGGA